MKINIYNDFSFLETNDSEIKNFIYQKLRFRDPGCFHNRAYKSKKWDGFVNFFDPINGKFLTGLLPEVKACLRAKGADFTENSAVEQIQFLNKEIDENFLQQFNSGREPVILRDYQVDLVNQVVRHKRGIIFAPTSAGKSSILVGILKNLPPMPTLVLQNRVSLADQNYEEIKKWNVDRLGKLWGGNVDPDLITVASVQSISKIEKLLPKIKVLLVDEIHDMMSKVPKAVYRKLKQCSIRVALSATPFKDDSVQKYSVKGFFGPVLKTNTTESGILTTKYLQDRDILSKSNCKFIEINEPQLPYEIYQDAITLGLAENQYFHKVVVKLAKKQVGRTLILVDRIAHGDALHAMLPGSLWVQGKDDLETRKYVIEQLKYHPGNIVCIATHHIFNTGVSFWVHSLINGASGASDHMIIQRMGRGLRTANDKEGLKYYDFMFNINKYLTNHSKKRIKILKKEGHDVSVITPDEI
jgi:superfamily II DNA or RNA helicase